MTPVTSFQAAMASTEKPDPSRRSFENTNGELGSRVWKEPWRYCDSTVRTSCSSCSSTGRMTCGQCQSKKNLLTPPVKPMGHGKLLARSEPKNALVRCNLYGGSGKRACNGCRGQGPSSVIRVVILGASTRKHARVLQQRTVTTGRHINESLARSVRSLRRSALH